MDHEQPSAPPRRRRASRGRALATALSAGGAVALTAAIAVTTQATAAPAAPRPAARAPTVDGGQSDDNAAALDDSRSAVPFLDQGPAPIPHTHSSGS